MKPGVVLSLFPGVGLLDRGFEHHGFCVFRGPDLLWGGDIRTFHPPRGSCWGIIGGSPCQDFSAARRAAPTGEGRKLMGEFARCVLEAEPEWWLLENVPRAPSVTEIKPELCHLFPNAQRIDVNAAWYSGVSRLRHFQFGSRTGITLQIPRGRPVRGAEPAALASDGRSFRELCRLQGLPDGYSLPGFTIEEAKRAVGNGVPFVLACVLAKAVCQAYRIETGAVPEFDETHCDRRRCACGCGRALSGRHLYDSAACRKRAERRRRRDSSMPGSVTGPLSCP